MVDFGEDAHVVVERDDGDAVVGSKLVEEGDGRVLYVFELEAGRARGVDDERDGKGLLDGGEVGDLMLDAVLEDAEVLLA